MKTTSSELGALDGLELQRAAGQTKQMLIIATAHGYRAARQDDTSVTVFIPWTRNMGKEWGVEAINCRTVREMYLALGY